MDERILQIVDYFQNYKDITIPNDELIKIISNLEIMESIELIDDMIINQFGTNIIDRLDFYNQIYHHDVWENIIKEIEYEDNKNYYIWAILLVELHKYNLTNQIIEYFPIKCKDTLVTKVFVELMIEEKNKYSKMIKRLVELAAKEKVMYSDIINLLEENKHIYSP